MGEIEKSSGNGGVADKKDGPRFMDRAKRERWDIPGSLRGPIIDRLVQIIHDDTAPNREVLSAVSAILAASKINLANISLTLKVHEYEELERRITELERNSEGAENGGMLATG
jgi:hypothetical protein